VDDPLLGVTVGSWKLTYLLGAGGMGRVYAAVQPEIGAKVAIKVIKPDSPPDVVERFFNEARAVNLIHHENIVDVIDLGKLPDGSPYIVMEHLDGASLGALLRRGRIASGTLASIVEQVLSALAAAHAKNVIHRDLKPDNVFVSPSGHATVLDFGVAKLARPEGVASTQSGNLLGTPAYMSPEQARSQPLDARSDLYSVGVILYEGATGRLPFGADNLFDLLDRIVRATPPTPRSIDPAIPEALEAVIVRAMAKEPSERFASASEMRDALTAAVVGLPRPSAIALPTVSDESALAATVDSADPNATQASIASPPREPRPNPTRPRPWIAIGALAVAAAGLSGVLLLRPHSHTEPAKPAPPTPPAGPTRFDPIAHYPEIAAQAAKIAGAKVLPHWFDFKDLAPDGTLAPTSEARYIFISPDRERAGGDCLVEIDVTTAGTTVVNGNVDSEGDKPAPCTGAIATPECTFAQLRAKAVEQGLPAASQDPVTMTHTGLSSWTLAAGSGDWNLFDDCH
jgi:serine/threonine protein kinase